MLSRRGFLFGTALKLCAQQTKFSTDVNVVTLLATVHDREGRVIKDLDRQDFVLEDNGKRQTITYFARESDLPLQIGLLVDTSRSQRGVLGAEKRASYKFLDQVLREGQDRALVARFDVDVEVTQGFTSSREELRSALESLVIPGRTATLLFEAVRRVSEEEMRREAGRKAFIILSDGVSFRDETSIGTAIEFAQRADVIIFAILFSRASVGLGRGGPRAAVGKKAMQRLSAETGGGYFEVTAHRPIETIYAEIENALRNQYSLGYTPAPPGKSGQYRKIKLTTRDTKLIAKTRDGYYPK